MLKAVKILEKKVHFTPLNCYKHPISPSNVKIGVK
uniref:Uncharacterized protein n=1 Tax=Arundo donax TaxID=35708 RepID=A0A0A9TSV9_ARUDO